MHAEVQLFGESGLVRVFESGKEYGDDYVWACTVRVRGDTVELLGVCKPPTWEQVRAVEAELVSHGYKLAVFERIKAGEPRNVVLKLRKR